jgi:hypothetical protein
MATWGVVGVSRVLVKESAPAWMRVVAPPGWRRRAVSW